MFALVVSKLKKSCPVEGHSVLHKRPVGQSKIEEALFRESEREDAKGRGREELLLLFVSNSSPTVQVSLY